MTRSQIKAEAARLRDEGHTVKEIAKTFKAKGILNMRRKPFSEASISNMLLKTGAKALRQPLAAANLAPKQKPLFSFHTVKDILHLSAGSFTLQQRLEIALEILS